MFGRMSPMVKSLLFVNVGVFLVTAFISPRFTSYLALYPLESEYFRPYQLFTYMFAHGGFTHLLFNMIGLIVFGNFLEEYWGSNRFLTFYLVTGIGAALIYGGVNFFTGGGGSMVGASGAIYGLLMAAGMLFPNTVVMLLFPPIPIKLKWLALALGGIALYSSLNNQSGDNVAHLAHLGGMIFAFILIKFWQKSKKNFF